MSTRRRRLIIGGAVALAAAVVAGGVIAGSAERQTAQQTAVEVAAPLLTLCETDRGVANRVGANCPQAAQVVAEGAVRTMQAGRGITGTAIVGGRLVVTYTDGATNDVGPVVGPGGPPGAPAPPADPGEDGADGVDGENGADGAVGTDGRGISGTAIVGGRLVVTYTDGSTGDLGVVVGPAGRGVASLDGSSGRLLVTLTDGEVIDAGPLPPGPRGDQGAAAPVIQSSTKTYRDGSTESCQRDGGTDTDPAFTCTRTGAPVVDPGPAPADPAPETTEGG